MVHDSVVNFMIFDEIRNGMAGLLQQFFAHPFPRVYIDSVRVSLAKCNLIGQSRYSGILLCYAAKDRRWVRNR